MSFAAPLGLLALLGLPVVVALHLFRRRLAERRVAGLFLWAPNRLAAAAGRRRTRLLRTASLVLELLCVLLLSLWLAGPRVGEHAPRVHLVLVLDDGASMRAVDADGEAAVTRAQAAAQRMIDDLPRDARVTVLRTGLRPELLVGPRVLAGSALRALEEWSPRAPSHDPAPAFDLALELVGAGDSGRVVFLTDGEPAAALPPGIEVRAFGVARANVAVLTARRHRLQAGEEQLLFDVQALGGSVRRAEVTVTSDGGAFEARTFEIALDPNGPPARLAPRFPASATAWRVRIGGRAGNALDLDDEAVLLAEPDTRLLAAVRLPTEVAARLRVSRLLEALDGIELLADEQAGDADLCFVTDPSAGPARAHQVLLQPLAGETDPWIGPYLVERRHPLMKGVALEGVVWTAGRGSLDGTPVAWAGQQVLIAEQVTAARTLRLHLQLDPLRTNLPASPDWPILVDNFANRVRLAQPGPLAVNLTVGEPIEYRLRDPAAGAWILRDPEGGERAAASGSRLLSWRARMPGLHDLVDPAGRIVQSFAVTYVDAGESDLASRATLELAAAPRSAELESSEAPPDGDFERRLLALLLVVLMAADWWVLRIGRGRA